MNDTETTTIARWLITEHQRLVKRDYMSEEGERREIIAALKEIAVASIRKEAKPDAGE